MGLTNPPARALSRWLSGRSERKAEKSRIKEQEIREEKESTERARREFDEKLAIAKECCHYESARDYLSSSGLGMLGDYELIPVSGVAVEPFPMHLAEDKALVELYANAKSLNIDGVVALKYAYDVKVPTTGEPFNVFQQCWYKVTATGTGLKRKNIQ